MDESVVAVALASVEKHIILLYQVTNSPRRVHDVFEKGKRCLEIQQAYLQDSKYQTSDGKIILQVDRKACIDIASEIHDVLDELMYKLLQQPFVRSMLTIKRSRKRFVKDAYWQVSECMERTVSMVDMEKTGSLLKDTCQPSAEEIFAYNFRKSDLKEEAVGFETVQRKIIKQLKEKDPAPSNIGIFGMGGCGKTTLVKMVYDSIHVRRHFSCKAWVKASDPNIQFDDLLKDIMSQFDLPKENESAETDEASRLTEYLHDKRYLIVIDDIRTPSDWKAIQYALPKSGKEGSKVVLTTRNSHIVSSSAKYKHDLSSGLSNDHAWELFCRKALINIQDKPSDVLGSWPEKFVKLCEGLPLAITTLGTWLSRAERNPSVWESKYNSLGYELGKAGSYLSVLFHNLQQSLSHLRSHLRSCFLYLSMFPEGQSITRGRLLRLWIAEGFVTPERGITIEQTAEDYLNELVARNLIVITSSEGQRGRVKRCRVLHLVRKINVSRHKSFATVVEYSASSGENYIHRLFIVNSPSNLSKEFTGSCVRSLLVFGKTKLTYHELESVCKTNKFLKVLDLNGADLNEFPRSILQLYLLKYLSLRNTKVKVVPKSICSLQSLETLDLKDTLVWRLPKEIGVLQRLRHLLLFESAKGVSGGVEISAKALRALSSIQKLSFIKVDEQLLEVLGELIGLRKLGLTDLREEDGYKLGASIGRMQYLSTLDVESASENEHLHLGQIWTPLYLQHLYLRGRLTMVPEWISKLTSLSKIVLTGSKLKLHVNPLEEIQDLPNLTELELVDYYIGDVLIFKAKKFLKLVKFAIKGFEKLSLVIVELGALSSLQTLVIQRCKYLNTLPDGIESLTLLREFLLYDMPDGLISRLKYYEYRQRVKHIRVVRSYIGWNNGTFDGVTDLSASVLEASTSSENQTSISLEVDDLGTRSDKGVC